jgi:hypothetical protein
MSYNDDEFEQHFRRKMQQEEEAERKRRESEVLAAPDEDALEVKGKQAAVESGVADTVCEPEKRIQSCCLVLLRATSVWNWHFMGHCLREEQRAPARAFDCRALMQVQRFSARLKEIMHSTSPCFLLSTRLGECPWPRQATLDRCTTTLRRRNPTHCSGNRPGRLLQRPLRPARVLWGG